MLDLSLTFSGHGTVSHFLKFFGVKLIYLDNPTDQVCYGKLISLENVAIWAMQSLLTDDKIIAAFFIGLYSMLGNHELQIIQRKSEIDGPLVGPEIVKI